MRGRSLLQLGVSSVNNNVLCHYSLEMKLAQLILRRYKSLPNGYIWSGKHRMYPNPNEATAARLTKRIQIEEQNMFYLRYPYLTQEETLGFSQAMGKKAERMERLKMERVQKITKPHIRLEDRLAGLNCSNAWD